MELNNFLIIIIGVVLIKIIYNSCRINKSYEGFYTSNTVKQHSAFSIFHDQQFANTTYYENDNIFKNTLHYENDENGQTGNKGVLTGWEKCKLSCPGNCLEYGLTSSAHCFLPLKPEDNRYGDEFSGKAKYQQENTTKI